MSDTTTAPEPKPTILDPRPHVMVDIETLADNSGDRPPVVFQIGLVLFSPGEGDPALIRNRAFLQCCPLDGIARGYRWTPDTIDWHRRQGTIFHGTNPLRKILADAYHILGSWEFEFIWSKAPDFDLAILRDLFRLESLGDAPWRYWQARDVRSICDPYRAQLHERDGKASHHALDDALLQARQVRDVLQHLRLQDLHLSPNIEFISDADTETIPANPAA